MPGGAISGGAGWGDYHRTVRYAYHPGATLPTTWNGGPEMAGTRRRWLPALGLAGIALLLVACGSSTDTATPGAGSTGTGGTGEPAEAEGWNFTDSNGTA